MGMELIINILSEHSLKLDFRRGFYLWTNVTDIKFNSFMDEEDFFLWTNVTDIKFNSLMGHLIALFNYVLVKKLIGLWCIIPHALKDLCAIFHALILICLIVLMWSLTAGLLAICVISLDSIINVFLFYEMYNLF